MSISKIEIKELIKQLDFKPVEGSHELYFKSFTNHSNYSIKINFEKEKIDYGNLIQKGDGTTCNFENSENFVVLECINRLLAKGYLPENLSLEHKWPMGRKEKGKLDILVYDSDKNSFLMIECKTWGEEYEKEKKKMLRDGGQLFSYFQQDKAAHYLCLYSSRLINTIIESKNDIIKVNPQWKELNNQKEIYDHWNKNFKDNGIFESWANPYDIEIKALTKGRLKELTEEDSGRIFNQFAEILRHNIVSDKPNAFNKIFNLFLCKIVDEDRNEEEELEFQWLDGDDDDKLQLRLNDLYKSGMDKYLHKKVTDFTDQEIDDKLYGVSSEERQGIKEIFHKLRLRKNNEFSFKEVFDEKSFFENAIVVREVVELLQPYQIRYSHKQQFLGDFFELLLNTGLKQEAGQFFTPVPIAKFIVSSIPIKELIQKKIKNAEDDILPYIIDFAAGSGHFLTESMDEIQFILDNLVLNKIKPTIKENLDVWKIKPFSWAIQYMYGIEADYRLVKTAKVSCFLNGDGMANVIHADGLDSFKTSQDFQGKLKEFNNDDSKDNCQFDIIATNPPYSVSAFKNTLKKGKESFELFDRLTDNSSEIECLFIERAKQLIKPSGWAGIILPSSMLSNSGIYTDTREIILKYFNIIAIAEFGSNTFMATGTNTITMFLERRKNTDWKNIKQRIDSFFQNPKEATVSGIENAFSIYIGFVFDNIELTDYISFVNKSPNDTMQLEELYKDYRSWFDNLTEIKDIKSKTAFKAKSLEEQKKELEKRFYEKIFEKEKDKMLYFFLTYPQKTVIVKVGSGQAEKDFLGYEFSNRRGHEGIKMYRDSEGKLTTKLYNEDISLSPDKSNYYIYNAFLKNHINIDSTISENVFVLNLIDLFDFKKVNFEKSINISVKKKVNKLISKWQLINISNFNPSIKIINGFAFKSSAFKNIKLSDYYLPVLKIGNIKDDNNVEFDNFTQYHIINDSKYIIEKGDLVIALTGATLGKCGIVKQKALLNQRVLCIRANTETINYLKIFLFSNNFYKYSQAIAHGNAQGNLSPTEVLTYQIPLPPIEIQEKIVKEIGEIEKKEKEEKKNIEILKKSKFELIDNIFGNDYICSNLKLICNKITDGSHTPPASQTETKFLMLSSKNINNDILNLDSPRFILESDFIKENRRTNIAKGDIMLTIVGAIGRSAIYNFDFSVTFQRSVAIIKPNTDKISSLFLKYCFDSQNVQEQIKDKAHGSSQLGLYLNDLATLKIPVPTIDEQNKIVDEIKKIEYEITNLENSINETEKQKQEILKKYL